MVIASLVNSRLVVFLTAVVFYGDLCGIFQMLDYAINFGGVLAQRIAATDVTGGYSYFQGCLFFITDRVIVASRD